MAVAGGLDRLGRETAKPAAGATGRRRYRRPGRILGERHWGKEGGRRQNTSQKLKSPRDAEVVEGHQEREGAAVLLTTSGPTGGAPIYASSAVRHFEGGRKAASKQARRLRQKKPDAGLCRGRRRPRGFTDDRGVVMRRDRDVDADARAMFVMQTETTIGRFPRDPFVFFQTRVANFNAKGGAI